MRQRNPAERSKQPDALVLQILMAAVSILMSLLLLFVPQLSVSVLCYAFCGAMIAIGVGMIVSFFLSEAYKQMHNYYFSIGVLLIILGCCGLLRNADLSERFEFFIGVTALVLAVFILQNMVQMRVLHNALWVVELVLAVPSLIGAILVLVNLRPLLNKLPTFPYWALLIASALSLISLLLTSIGLVASSRRAAKQAAAVPVAPVMTPVAQPVAPVAPVTPVAQPVAPVVEERMANPFEDEEDEGPKE